MRRVMAAGAALAASLFLGLAPVGAQWTMTQRTKFLSDCIPASDGKSPPAKEGQCALFCNCLANGGEKLFSSADFEEMDADARAGRDSPKLQQLSQTVVPACNRQVFGQ